MRILRRLWIRLVCWDLCPILFHHGAIRVVQEFDGGTRKLVCVRCGKYFGMSDREQAVLPWDADFEKHYCEMYGIERTNR